MIIIKLIGGLGNQMFQYAVAKALSLEKKQKLFIDKSAFENYTLHQFGLHHFKIERNFYKKPSKNFSRIKTFLKLNYYFNEKQFNYDPSLFEINANTVFLDGYFQSEKYFKKYETEIRSDFQIITTLKEATIQILDKLKHENGIAIHIRRGDYLEHDIHNTNKDIYYKEAMKYMESKVKNPVYYLFSDDMNWVKENFKTNFEAVYIDFNDATTNYEDLKLMSNCKHNIIANSSFSWWGAWLNNNPNKIVIAPKKWFNDEIHNYEDVVPNKWVKI